MSWMSRMLDLASRGNQSQSSTRPKKLSARRLQLENLERRELLSVTTPLSENLVPPDAPVGPLAPTGMESGDWGADDPQDTAEAPQQVKLRIPAVPENLHCTDCWSTKLDLKWNTADRAEEYRIGISTNGSTWSICETIEATRTSYRVKDLSPDTTYYFRVRSINAAGKSDPSNVISVKTKLAVPNPPGNLHEVNSWPTKIRLAWDAVSYAETYQVSRLNAAGTDWDRCGGEVTGTSNTIDSLTPGVTYTFRVKAINSVGRSDASNIIQVATPAVPAPSNIRAPLIGTTMVDVHWDAATNYADGYRVGYSTDGGNHWTIAGDTTGTNLRVKGLTPGAVYDFRVRAYHIPSNSTTRYYSQADVIEDVRTDDGIPDAPRNLHRVDAWPTKIRLAWDAVSDADCYQVSRLNTAGTDWDRCGGEVTGTSNTITEFSPGATYTFRVKAINGFGRSVASNIVHITTPEVPAPSNIRVPLVEPTMVDVHWDAAPNYADGYRVGYSTDGGSHWTIAGDTTGTNLRVQGLTPGVVYQYRVRAYHIPSGSTTKYFSEPIVTPPIDLRPDAPQNLHEIDAWPTKIRLAWDGVSDAETYQVSRLNAAGTDWDRCGGEVTGTSNTITNLEPGVAYTFRVKAINGFGRSGASNIVQVTTTVVSAPGYLRTDGVWKHAVQLCWSAVDHASEYQIGYSEDGGVSWNRFGRTDQTNLRVTGLDADKVYSFRVKAVHEPLGSTQEYLSDAVVLENVSTNDERPMVRQIDPVWFEVNTAIQASSIGEEGTRRTLSGETMIANEWIVDLTETALDDVGSVPDAVELLAPYGVEVVEGLGMEGMLLVRIQTAGLSVNAQSDLLAQIVEIEHFEPNLVIETITGVDDFVNDPRADELWGLDRIGVAEAWQTTTGDDDVVVAVLDTGVNINHPDLYENIFYNTLEIAGNGIDDDQNGFVDDVCGWNFRENNENVADDNGHGTHVSGTIGATANNGQGVVGVNHQVSVMPVRFLGGAAGRGSTKDALRGVNYITQMKRSGVNVAVINASFGGGGYDRGMANAIAAAGEEGILFVAAAGNSETNTDLYPQYPAGYELNNIISVAATNSNDNLSWFSNYGVTSVDIAAPGDNILSTYTYGDTPGYGRLSGTSMAAPHVAGVAALCVAAAGERGISVEDLRNVILSTAEPLPSLQGKVATGGLLDAKAAVEAVGSIVPPGPMPPITVDLQGSTLFLIGSDVGDSIVVDQTETGIVIIGNGKIARITSPVSYLIIDSGPGDDKIVNNTAIPSTIYAGAGGDIVLGGFDADLITGGTEDDEIYGRGGADEIHGDAGNDRIYGGARDDYIDAGEGDDIVEGGRGCDELIGGPGNDTLKGQQHDDILRGNAGADILRGGKGNDEIYGGRGDDYIRGGRGDDRIEPGRGDNRLLQPGDSGSDTVDADPEGTILTLSNLAPIARNDTVSTAVNEPAVIDVRMNDVDPDGDVPQLSGFAQPAHGRVELDAAGCLVYTPDDGFQGEDVFHYTIVDDSGATAAAEARIVVESPVPDAPHNLYEADATPTTIRLRWNAVSGANCYQVQLSVNGTNWDYCDTAVGDTSITIGDLDPGTAYRFRVKAMNEAGGSVPSNVVQATTAVVPMPENIRLELNELWWDAPASFASGYRAAYRLADGSSPWISAGETTNTRVRLGGLTPDTAYEFRVNAYHTPSGSTTKYFSDSKTAILTTPAALSGDLNGDFLVNGSDLNIIRANWGETVTPNDSAHGDANGDGVVNSGDLDVLRANWGSPAAASTTPAVADAIHAAGPVATPTTRGQMAEASWIRELESRQVDSARKPSGPEHSAALLAWLAE